MISELERQLKVELDRLAASVDVDAEVSASTRAAIRRRTARHRIVVGSAAVILVTAAAIPLAVRPWSNDRSEEDSATTAPVASSAPGYGAVTIAATTTTETPWDGRPSTPLAGSAAASCVGDYSLGTLAERAFGFDGTVIGVAGAGSADVQVTLQVNEWFRGADPSVGLVTVDVPSPGTGLRLADGAPWGVGSRLLVAGEPRFGSDPLDQPTAWMCGFSRTYDPATADDWRRAFVPIAQTQPPSSITG